MAKQYYKSVVPMKRGIRIYFSAPLVGGKSNEFIKCSKPESKASQTYAYNKLTKLRELVDKNELTVKAYAELFPNSRKLQKLKSKFGFNGDKTVKHYLAAGLLSAAATRAHSTHEHYQKQINAYIEPKFGHRDIDTITADELEAWQTELYSTRKAHTVNNVFTPLRLAFKKAMRDGAINRDVAALVANLKNERPREPNPFTPSEAYEIIKQISAMHPQAGNYCQFLFFTGLRPSEAICLTWEDLDFENNTVTINKAFVSGNLKSPKSIASNRVIHLFPEAIEALKAQRQFTGLARQEIFHNPMCNKPWNNSAFGKRYWHPVLKKLNLKSREPYQMRHTYATWCLSSGEEIYAVSKSLGHSTTIVTQTRYARWIPNKTFGDKFKSFVEDDLDSNQPTEE